MFLSFPSFSLSSLFFCSTVRVRQTPRCLCCGRVGIIFQQILSQVLHRVGGPLLDQLRHALKKDRHDCLIEVGPNRKRLLRQLALHLGCCLLCSLALGLAVILSRRILGLRLYCCVICVFRPRRSGTRERGERERERGRKKKQKKNTSTPNGKGNLGKARAASNEE